MLGTQVVIPQMVGDARFANVKLLTRKLGGTEINIVPNIFAEFASPKYGLKHKSNISVCVSKPVWPKDKRKLGAEDSNEAIVKLKGDRSSLQVVF